MHRVSKWYGVTAAALLLAGFMSGPALATEGAGSHPASLLLFPYFSNEPGTQTFFRITNTSRTGWIPIFEPNIQVHLVFFYQVPRVPPQRPICNHVSRFQPFTPNDTWLASTNSVASGATRGFFIAKAAQGAGVGDSDINWDFLVGDEIVLNTAEGWAWSINAIGILADQDSGTGTTIVAGPSPSTALLGSFEAALGGTDVDALDYEYINFHENFYFQYLTTRLGRASDVVFVPLLRTSQGTATLVDDTTTITPITPPAIAASSYSFDVLHWDADEFQISQSRGQIDCWDVRNVDQLTNNNASTFAFRGYGWMNIAGFDNAGVITTTIQRAVLVVVDRPTVGGIRDAFALYPTGDVSPGGNFVPPYIPSTFDISRF